MPKEYLVLYKLFGYIELIAEFARQCGICKAQYHSVSCHQQKSIATTKRLMMVIRVKGGHVTFRLD